MNKITIDLAFIHRIQAGDGDAYNAIYEAYRGLALTWANQVVHDSHIAEDVVQEAFYHLQMKIAGLHDYSRFEAWFRTMVRRLAINQIRGTRNRVVASEIMPDAWTSRADERQAASIDPLEALLHTLSEEAYTHSLDVLSDQARTIMNAYIKDDSTPEQLANRFNLAKSNIYNIISRSRTKVNEERFREEIARLIGERRMRGQSRRMLLEAPAFSRPYSLLSVAVLEAVRYAGDHDWSLTDVMGITGEAFRLNVTAGCLWRDISTYDWSYAAYRSMERMGWQGTCFGRPGKGPVSPEQQARVLELIQQSIDDGYPAIVWNLCRNEFSFIYGYDDETRMLTHKSFRKEPLTCGYSDLGRSGDEPAIFVVVLHKKGVTPLTTDSIIDSIIDHARGKEPAIPGFSFGLEGYRLWIRSIENEYLDLKGHAYQVAILSESRQYAIQFLYQLSDTPEAAWMRDELLQAAGCYEKALAEIRLLYPSFPFGYSGSDGGLYERMKKGLQAALEAEEEGIGHLEAAITKKKFFSEM